MNFVGEYPRLMSTDLAQEFVGGRTIFDALRKHKLIEPKIQVKNLTRYDRVLLEAACDAFRPEMLDGGGAEG